MKALPTRPDPPRRAIPFAAVRQDRRLASASRTSAYSARRRHGGRLRRAGGHVHRSARRSTRSTRGAATSFSGFYDYNRRTTWEPWGNLAEFDPDQKSFTRFGASLGKSFFLPKFQRIGIDINYLDGKRLDRFSKYELGFFGSQRVHGVQSGSVRAERAILGHLSYGFVFSAAVPASRRSTITR